VTAEALLQELHSRGVQLAPEGDRIRYRAPRGVLTPDLKAKLSEHKAEVLSVLQAQGAVLIASPRFGEVWMALDPCMADQLRAEESQRTDPRPVLTAADLAHLEDRSPQMVEAMLNTITAFPGTRVLQ
jgi:hypothetical protein